MKVLGINKGAMAVILVAALFASVAAGATDVSAIKKKSGTVVVSVARWSPLAQDMLYEVYDGVHSKAIGRLTFNFWYHEIETDEPTFTLAVKFNTVGLHKDQKIFVCITDVDADVTHCSKTFKYKPDKKMTASVDMRMAIPVVPLT